MYALIRLSSTYSVQEKRRLIIQDNRSYRLKYARNRKFYRHVFEHDDKKILTSLMHNLNLNSPRVVVPRVKNLVGINHNINQEHCSYACTVFETKKKISTIEKSCINCDRIPNFENCDTDNKVDDMSTNTPIFDPPAQEDLTTVYITVPSEDLILLNNRSLPRLIENKETQLSAHERNSSIILITIPHKDDLTHDGLSLTGSTPNEISELSAKVSAHEKILSPVHIPVSFQDPLQSNNLTSLMPRRDLVSTSENIMSKVSLVQCDENNNLHLSSSEMELFKKVNCTLYDSDDNDLEDSDDEDKLIVNEHSRSMAELCSDSEIEENNDDEIVDQLEPIDDIRDQCSLLDISIQTDDFNLSHLSEQSLQNENLIRHELDFYSVTGSLEKKHLDDCLIPPTMTSPDLSDPSPQLMFKTTLDPVLSEVFDSNNDSDHLSTEINIPNIPYSNESDTESSNEDIEGMNKDLLEAYKRKKYQNTQKPTPQSFPIHSNTSKDLLDSSDVPTSTNLSEEPTETSSAHTSSITDREKTMTENQDHLNCFSEIPGNNIIENDENELESNADGKSEKLYWCDFCKSRISRFGRHLITIHKTKKEVLEFTNLPPKSMKRKRLIAKIRDSHGSIYNKTDKAKEYGLQVARLPNKKISLPPDQWIPCPCCQKYVRANTMRYHYLRCSSAYTENNRGILVQSRRLMDQIHESATKVVKEDIFAYIHDDPVKEFIRNDELVILYANTLIEKYTSPEEHAMVRQRLRMIGRFLREVRTLRPDIKNLATLLTPGNYQVCLLGVKKVAGMSEDGTECESPSTATALGTLLKKICAFLITLYIERQEHDKKNQAEDLMKLFHRGFEIINRRAKETLAARKLLKKVVLPSQNDIEMLTNYLEKRREKAYNKLLKKKYDFKYWLLLAETTLLLIQVFNRRREGEASKTKVGEYHNATNLMHPNNKDYYDSLSADEKRNANEYIRIEVRGKLGRPVPMLLNTKVQESIDMLLNYRKAAEVPDGNQYLFGLPMTTNDKRFKRLSAGRLLNEYAELCGAKNPETLRGTILRKHIATVIANNNLTSTGVSDVADFLGHAEKIHKSHYRQKDCRQITEMPKVLEAGMRKQSTKSTVSFINASDTITDESLVSHDRSFSPTPAPTEPINNQRTNEKPQLTRKKTQKQQKRGLNKSNSSDEDDEPEPKKKLCTRTAWTKEEVEIIMSNFSNYLMTQSYPCKTEIEGVINKNKTVIGKRQWKHVKAWMSNYYKKAKSAKK